MSTCNHNTVVMTRNTFSTINTKSSTASQQSLQKLSSFLSAMAFVPKTARRHSTSFCEMPYYSGLEYSKTVARLLAATSPVLSSLASSCKCSGYGPFSSISLKWCARFKTYALTFIGYQRLVLLLFLLLPLVFLSTAESTSQGIGECRASSFDHSKIEVLGQSRVVVM